MEPRFARLSVPLYEASAVPRRRAQVQAALELRPEGWVLLSLLEEPSEASHGAVRTDDVLAAESGRSRPEARPVLTVRERLSVPSRAE